MSHFKELLDKIRTEPFVLWAGAGMSLYAGFPTGKQIADHLNKLLDEELPGSAGLDEIASAYQLKYSREALIEVIKTNFFQKPPVSKQYHSLLATIPIFKTIITTNFDPLFEFSYGDALVKICSMEDFPRLNTGKTELIKLHSDFSNPARMVITKEDYQRFISKDRSELLYDVVKSELARNHVVLVGYAFEDINALLLHYDLMDQLGDRKKAWWLVCPGMKAYQMRALEAKNIHVVDATGEEFIETLKKTFDDNIIRDFKQKRISTSILSRYLVNHDIIPTIKSMPGGDELIQIEGGANPLSGTLGFKFQTSPDVKFNEQLNRVLQGASFKELQFNQGEVMGITKRVNGILLEEISGVENMTISTTPLIDETVSLKFEDKQIDGVLFKFFRSPTHAGVRITFHNFSFETDFEWPMIADLTTSIHIDIAGPYPSALVGCQIYSLMLFGMTNQDVTIIRKDGPFKIGFHVKEDYKDRAMLFFNHFKQLLEIEDFFKLQFSNIEITREAIEAVHELAAQIKGVRTNSDPVKITFEHDKKDYDTLIEASKKNEFDFNFEYSKPHEPIYGTEIPVGRYRVKTDDAIMPNFDDFINKKVEELEFISKSGHMISQLLHPVL